VELVNTGRLTESRIDESARRLLRMKFQLGLFDDPFVDESEVDTLMGHPDSVAAGLRSQQRAMTLLKNEDHALPLQGQPKIFVRNIEASVAEQYAHVVAPAEARLCYPALGYPGYQSKQKSFRTRPSRRPGF
jgi:beta-glucosidase